MEMCWVYNLYLSCGTQSEKYLTTIALNHNQKCILGLTLGNETGSYPVVLASIYGFFIYIIILKTKSHILTENSDGFMSLGKSQRSNLLSKFVEISEEKES